jgi:UDP-glucuronate decarboxylase
MPREGCGPYLFWIHLPEACLCTIIRLRGANPGGAGERRVGIQGRKILLTGGAGFIGTALCRELADDNQILLYDSLWRNAIQATGLLEHPHVELIVGDVLDRGALARSVDGVDMVLHMAAIAGIDTVVRDPIRTMKVNILGTINLLDALEPMIGQLERFVFFSTSEVFGSYAYKRRETETTNLQPVGEGRWTYSVSKLAAEHLVHSYHRQHGLRSLSIRPFNVYGPGQVGEGAIHVFIDRALRGVPLRIHGDGDQIRSWCYVDDMVRGILLSLEKEEAVGQVFNIGNPRGTTTILSLAEKIRALANSSSPIVHVPKHYVDVELRIPSIEHAQELLGFQPRVDLSEGLRATIDWYRARL